MRRPLPKHDVQGFTAPACLSLISLAQKAASMKPVVAVLKLLPGIRVRAEIPSALN